jgi:hypothetical protein
VLDPIEMEICTYHTLWDTLTVKVGEEINVVEICGASSEYDNGGEVIICLPWSNKGPLIPAL